MPKENREKSPLSEEELLSKPFYTIQEEPEIEENREKSQSVNLLPSLAESQSENYRELIPKLLLNVRIQNPRELRNNTVSLKVYFMIFLKMKILTET